MSYLFPARVESSNLNLLCPAFHLIKFITQVKSIAPPSEYLITFYSHRIRGEGSLHQGWDWYCYSISWVSSWQCCTWYSQDPWVSIPSWMSYHSITPMPISNWVSVHLWVCRPSWVLSQLGDGVSSGIWVPWYVIWSVFGLHVLSFWPRS